MADEREYHIINSVARFCGRLGMNETRVRWKLLALVRKREETAERAATAASHVGYEHQVCGHCGRIVPAGEKTCPGCERRLEPRLVQQLRRAGMHSPVPLSVSTLIGAVILVAFIRQVLGSGSFMTFDAAELLRVGGHYPFLEKSGEWWRLGTAVLLHGGIIHLVFNLFALAQVGPVAEDTFGPGRTLAFFLIMGVAANVPALLMDRNSVGIGASGAILGLAGLAAGWGQAQGTTLGRRLRNSMLMWLLYVTIFGLMMRVDHLAHVTGFAAGFGLGFTFHGERKREGRLDVILGLAGFVVLLVLLALILFPPRSPLLEMILR